MTASNIKSSVLSLKRLCQRIGAWLALITLFFIQACATPAAQKPRTYDGLDTVGAFTADAIVGTWRMTPLSFTPTADDPVVVITINADGTAVSRTTPPEGAEINFVFESTGTWEIIGDELSTEMTSLREVSGNRAAALLGSLASGFVKNDQLSGKANPYVLTPDRMVIVGQDGYAMQYDRTG